MITCDKLATNIGYIGLITLKRDEKLNALNFNMITTIQEFLISCNNDNNCMAVIITGAGRAFCAGGDIQSIYTAGKANAEKSITFFFHEYRLNQYIKTFPKPYIALLHGISMGGGLGIAINGSIRIGANNLNLAMPETGIGFYPDIGGCYFLSRCPGAMGVYLGLTGKRINIAEAIYLNLIDYNINQNKFSELIQDLTAIQYNNNNNKISAVINKYSTNDYLNLVNDLENNRDNIEHCFSATDIKTIFNNLIKLNNAWSKKNLAILETKSPSSLIITLQALTTAKQLNFSENMQMEYNLTNNFLHNNDFYEGVRALLIDKDNNPKWDNISNKKPEDIINKYFHKNIPPLEFIQN